MRQQNYVFKLDTFYRSPVKLVQWNTTEPVVGQQLEDLQLTEHGTYVELMPSESLILHRDFS